MDSAKGKGSRFMVEIPMQKADDAPEQVIQTYIHRKYRNINVVAIDNDEVLRLMLKEMYAQEGIHCDTLSLIHISVAKRADADGREQGGACKGHADGSPARAEGLSCTAFCNRDPSGCTP